MRVVAGRWRGRKLRAPRGDSVRPTSDRVKEALFSIIGPALEGADVADLCCGAGGLGIEALSRGAARVHFVDLARRSLDAAAANLKLCGAGEPQAVLVREDALRWLRRRIDSGLIPEVVICDPPYASGIAAAVWELLLGLTADRAPRLTVVEHSAADELPVREGSPGRISRRVYGETALTIREI